MTGVRESAAWSAMQSSDHLGCGGWQWTRLTGLICRCGTKIPLPPPVPSVPEETPSAARLRVRQDTTTPEPKEQTNE